MTQTTGRARWLVAAEPRLLWPSYRAVVLALIALCAVVVGVFGLRYAGDTTPGVLDRAIDPWLHARARGHGGTLDHYVELGNVGGVVVCCGMLVGVAVVSGRLRMAVLGAIAPAMAGGVAEWLLKPLIGRRFDVYLAYPSGHTTGAFAVATVVVVWLVGPSTPAWGRARRASVGMLAALLAAGVGLGMVALGAHYVTDVVGGVCVGVGVVVAVALIVDVVSDQVLAQPS